MSTTAPGVERRDIDAMSQDEREAYYEEIEKLVLAGKSTNEIERIMGLSHQSARRHVAFVKGRIEGRKQKPSPNGTQPAVEGRNYPLVAISKTHRRQVPSLADERDPLQGRRLTQSSGPSRIGQVVPPPESGEWRLETTSPEEIRRMIPADLIIRLIRVSPEMARAYFDFLRMANPGHDLKAYVPGTDTPHPVGQEWLNYFEKKLAARNQRGSADVIYNSMLANAYVRGANFCELVLAADARTFVDIAVPDAYSARFRVAADPEAGGIRYQLIQGSGRSEVVLDRPTIIYSPVDPLPDTPYGTSPIAPGLFPSLFLITMLQDARRVVAQQGWPRLDIMVKVAELIATMDEKDQRDPEKVQAHVSSAVTQIAASYSALEPDQAWVHSDTVEFGTPVGAIGSLEGIDALVSVLERMCVRSLKSQPLLFALPEGVSEANANRQWEVHVQGVQALQELVASALSTLYTLALEAEGVDAEARFTFHELRVIEELREAQALFQKLENAQLGEVLGYFEHDEASTYAVGHPAAETPIGVVGNEEDQPEEEENTENPTAGEVGAGDTGDEDDIQGDDGANRIHRDPGFQTLVRMLGNPSTAIGVAYAMALLRTRREVPKMEPKGEPQHDGDETVVIDRSDFRAAERDFDFRVPDYAGILSAEPVPA